MQTEQEIQAALALVEKLLPTALSEERWNELYGAKVALQFVLTGKPLLEYWQPSEDEQDE